MLKDLVELLDCTNTDYWHDEASCEARALLDAATDTQLMNLQQSWAGWSSTRQERLAYVLGEAGRPIELSILKAMTLSDSPDLVYVALESLRAATMLNATLQKSATGHG